MHLFIFTPLLLNQRLFFIGLELFEPKMLSRADRFRFVDYFSPSDNPSTGTAATGSPHADTVHLQSLGHRHSGRHGISDDIHLFNQKIREWED